MQVMKYYQMPLGKVTGCKPKEAETEHLEIRFGWQMITEKKN